MTTPSRAADDDARQPSEHPIDCACENECLCPLADWASCISDTFLVSEQDA